MLGNAWNTELYKRKYLFGRFLNKLIIYAICGRSLTDVIQCRGYGCSQENVVTHTQNSEGVQLKSLRGHFYGGVKV